MSAYTRIKEEKIELVQSYLKRRGYEPLKGGVSFAKTRSNGNRVRFKFMPRVIRYEIFNENIKQWVHLRSATYSDVMLDETVDKLTGFKRTLF